MIDNEPEKPRIHVKNTEFFEISVFEVVDVEGTRHDAVVLRSTRGLSAPLVFSRAMAVEAIEALHTGIAMVDDLL